jgi:hypothetical protein
MPRHVAPGDSNRYWFEVQKLNRLIVSMEKDGSLDEGKRRAAIEKAEAFKADLTLLAKGQAA